MTNIPKPSWKAAILCRCPACGKGGVFQGLIKIASNCPTCGTDLSKYETADGPASFAIAIIGALVGLGAGILEVVKQPPLWQHFAIWIPVIFLGSLLVVRISKTLMIAHQMDLR